MEHTDRDINIRTGENIPLWRDVRVLQAMAQIISAIVVIGLVAFLALNMFAAAEARGLSLGFGFLDDSAGFAIDGAPIDYDPSMSFGRALLVGLLNTLRVALLGIVLATVLGIVVGLARLSSNWLVRNIANVYIESIRNIPLLVLLFFWFFAVFQQLPPVENSIKLGPYLILNQRGVYVPALHATGTFFTWLALLLGGIVLSLVAWRVLTSYRLRTGRPTYPLVVGGAILILLPLLGWLLLPEQPLTMEFPVLGSFNYEGGSSLTTNFSALLVGLVMYTASFIAEIVRAGIQSVSRGQVDAARSIGLSNLQALRLVVFPQALRVILPPLISQYLNLTKNSSLAVFIGFKDFFAVGKTIIDQAGRAVPVFALIMLGYLVMSLTYSILINLYNRRVRFVER